VDLLRIVRDVEPFGLYKGIVVLQKPSRIIVQLPCDLYTTRPVVGIADGGVPPFGEACGLGIKYEVHGQFSEFREDKNIEMQPAMEREFLGVINQ
jgi:hypothetical protein